MPTTPLHQGKPQEPAVFPVLLDDAPSPVQASRHPATGDFKVGQRIRRTFNLDHFLDDIAGGGARTGAADGCQHGSGKEVRRAYA